MISSEQLKAGRVMLGWSAQELADTYGERFTPPKSLVEKAEKGEIFK